MNVDCPFIVDLLYSFNTNEKVNFVMPFIRGGDMFNLMRSVGKFPEDQARFYIMQVAIALGYLH
jgi:serine/threonine protein kinase